MNTPELIWAACYEMSPLSGEERARKEYLEQFSRAPQVRTQRYKQLEKGFDAVLQTHDESQYKTIMAEVTVAFKVCSEAVNSAEAGLRDMRQDDLADMLRIVQTNEQEKLHLTLILQALRQSHARGFSWQTHAPAEVQSKPDLPQQSCHCCTTAEPSEEEFTAAKGEALQGLQVAIDNINDVLEELKYAEAEYNE